MHVSRYVKAYDNGDDTVTLYSIITSAIAVVERDVWERMTEGELSPSEQDFLHEEGFLVRDPEEETRQVQSMIEMRDRISRRLSLVSVMNLDCNLDCVYCFEGDIKQRQQMSEETADLLIDYITHNLTREKNELSLDFYGGEPLMSLALVRRIASQAREVAMSRGVVFGFSFITNGTLLTKRIVEDLLPLGLKGAKVTLDGPREIHDAFRPFKGGKGSFDTIIRNLKDITDKIKIAIGGNYTRDNYRRFPELLDYLMGEGLTPDRISMVKFDPVATSDNLCGTAAFTGGCKSMNEPWLVEAGIFLREAIMKRGFSTQIIRPASCVLHNSTHVVVNYDGTLYKCPGFLGMEEYCVGTLRDGLGDFRTTYKLDSCKNAECPDCEYLPICHGGCKFMQMLERGDIEGVGCRREYFDKVLEPMIRQEIKYMEE